MDSILFKIGSLTISYYGIFLSFAFLIGLYLTINRAKRELINKEKILILSIYLIIFCHIGAKIFSLIFERDFATGTGSFNVLDLFKPGSIYYGGIISGIIVTLLYCSKERLSFWTVVNIYAPSIALGHSIGKIGCYLDGCCYGEIFFIPTQIFESFSSLIIFVVLLITSKNQFLLYLIFYGTSRFFVEFFREDYRGGLIFNLVTISQFISIILIITGGILLLINSKKHLKKEVNGIIIPILPQFSFRNIFLHFRHSIEKSRKKSKIERKYKLEVILYLFMIVILIFGTGSSKCCEKKPIAGIITKVLAIINPAVDSKFVIELNEINCEAKIGMSDLNTEENRNKIEWDVPEISDSRLIVGPFTRKGTNIKITYSGLPYDNGQFGDKTLRVKLEANSKKYEDSRNIRIFFSRDATNHPGVGLGVTRNWYYYWKTGGVVSDLYQFEYKDTDFYGEYDRGSRKLYVGNAAPETNDGPKTVSNQYYLLKITSGPDGICNTSIKSGSDDVQVIPINTNTGNPYSIVITAGPNNILDTAPGSDDTIIPGLQFSIGSNGKGINCTAETCSHELKHKWIHDNWSGQDSDEDKVPNSEEGKPPYYFHPHIPDTYNLKGLYPLSNYDKFGDSEFLARVAEQSPGPVNPNNDWSDTNGKNWVK